MSVTTMVPLNEKVEALSARVFLLDDKENTNLVIELRLELTGEKEMRVGAGLGPEDALHFGQRMVGWALMNGAKSET